MKAFKGFDKDLKCRDFQFEEGKTYEEKTADLCNSGFHACEAPIDVFKFYPPASSVYHAVELDEVSPQREETDSKVCAKKITIGARLDIRGLVNAQIEYTKAKTTMVNTDPKQATAGDFGAATAGDRGAATAGDFGAATAGDFGAATSRGKTAVGENGIGLARGNDVMVKGGMGAVLLIAEEEKHSYDLAAWKAFVVDGEKIKADTWYQLKDGELVEAKEDSNEQH